MTVWLARDSPGPRHFLLGRTIVIAALARPACAIGQRSGVGRLAGSGFILLVDPHLYTYAWFLGPYVIAASLASLSILASHQVRAGPAWFTRVCWCCLSLLVRSKRFAKRPSSQAYPENSRSAITPNCAQVVPPCAVVLIYAHGGLLGRQRLSSPRPFPRTFPEERGIMS